jgi:DNA-binding protein HU-beta
MNRSEIINNIANETNITKVKADKVIQSFTSCVVAALKKGDTVTLVGFGTFFITNKSARNGRNPQTGEIIKIKATKTPRFKAGKVLSEIINK